MWLHEIDAVDDVAVAAIVGEESDTVRETLLRRLEAVLGKGDRVARRRSEPRHLTRPVANVEENTVSAPTDTDADSDLTNPYVEQAAEWLVFPEDVPDDPLRRAEPDQEIAAMARSRGEDHEAVRERFVYEYAWAVPNRPAVEAIVEYGPVVEIGAGLGYWGWLVEQLGGDYVGYDPDPRTQLNDPEAAVREDIVARGDRHGREFEDFVHDGWTDVREGDHRAAADHPDRTLFLCWPSQDADWAHKALDAYDGDTLVYVGEGPGGVTGDEQFFEELRREWGVVDSVSIPQWPFVDDRLVVYER